MAAQIAGSSACASGSSALILDHGGTDRGLLLLAERLVESLDPIADDEVRASWTAEAIRRRDEVRSGNVEAISGDAAAAQVRALLRK
jgi:hypothetical protein